MAAGGAGVSGGGTNGVAGAIGAAGAAGTMGAAGSAGEPGGAGRNGAAGQAGSAGAGGVIVNTGCVKAVLGRYLLRDDGTVLQDDGTTPVRDATAAPLGNVTSVSDGTGHGCAALHDGTVSCWSTKTGGNDAGQLGNGGMVTGTLNRATQVLTAVGQPLTGVTAVAQAPIDYYGPTNDACVVTQAGELYCWGDITWLVNGGKALSSAYAQAITSDGLNTLSGVQQAALSQSSSACVVVKGSPSNEVRCWGQNAYYNLGTGDAMPRQYPTKVLGLTNPSQVSISAHANGGYHATTCALDGGNVRCWGYNGTVGETGTNNGTALTVNVPTLVTTASGAVLDRIVDLQGGGDEDGYLTGHPTCAVRDDKTLWCWGTSYHTYAANYGIPNVTSAGYVSRNPRFLTTDGAYHIGTAVHNPTCGAVQ